MGYFEQIGWSPSIGDPTFLGWFTVFAYFFTAILAFKASSNVKNVFIDRDQRLRRLWYFIGVLFICLAINKQLDLQSFFTKAMKHMALEQGWYSGRRELQRTFIFIVIGVGLMSLVVLTTAYAQHLRSHLIAFIGLAMLLMFILIRATSFHNVDILLYEEDNGFKLNNILELLGIGLVAFNAQFLAKHHRQKRVSKRPAVSR